MNTLDVKKIRKDFPVFKKHPHLVYLDSTATSLKPRVVIDKIVEYYEKYPANIHRGIYDLSEKASYEYEETRSVVAKFIGAESPDEIIFTRSTTEGINLVAYSLGREIITEGDEIATSIMEHHSNFVPWQKLACETGAVLKVIDIDDDGKLNLGAGVGAKIGTRARVGVEEKGRVRAERGEESGSGKRAGKEINMKGVISKKTKILALTYVSNVLGTINPLKKIIKNARAINPKIIVVVDAAQAAPHIALNVKNLDCDFLSFSSHKMCGPTGVGVLWGRKRILEEMSPFNYGGDMINGVYLDRTMYKKTPHKFEAGTPHISGVIALKTAIHYIEQIGLKAISEHEYMLMKYVRKCLDNEHGRLIHILGPKKSRDRVGVCAFAYEGIHPHDIASLLNEDNIAVRAGHHCAMPLHERLGIPSSTRASFYLYNSTEDIDKLMISLKKIIKLFS